MILRISVCGYPDDGICPARISRISSMFGPGNQLARAIMGIDGIPSPATAARAFVSVRPVRLVSGRWRAGFVPGREPALFRCRPLIHCWPWIGRKSPGFGKDEGLLLGAARDRRSRANGIVVRHARNRVSVHRRAIFPVGSKRRRREAGSTGPGSSQADGRAGNSAVPCLLGKWGMVSAGATADCPVHFGSGRPCEVQMTQSGAALREGRRPRICP